MALMRPYMSTPGPRNIDTKPYHIISPMPPKKQIADGELGGILPVTKKGITTGIQVCFPRNVTTCYVANLQVKDNELAEALLLG
jgi:hypothetical protein